MNNSFDEMQNALLARADLQARLNLMPYDGTPEIKTRGEVRYLYVRKRIAGKLTSTYVGIYTDELYNLLLHNAGEARQIRKELRQIEKQLIKLGYSEDELSARVLQNIDFARANMKTNIYDQAVLEGVATSFPQTEEIIENGKVNGVTATDVQKILNLKHAWEFILDRDVIRSKSDYYMLCHIARLVNEGFFAEGGRIRGVPVTIGSSSYVPPLPNEYDVKNSIAAIADKQADAIDVAIELCLFCMKTQVFLDGNKRAAVIFANQYLISHGGGCEDGESYEECICREVKEETGFEVSNLGYCACAEEYILHETIGGFHPIQYYYTGTLTNKKCEPTETDHKLVWLPVDGIENKMHSKAQWWAVKYEFLQRGERM